MAFRSVSLSEWALHVYVSRGDDTFQLRPVTDDTMPSVLGDFVALLARASDTDSGAVAVLHRLGPLMHADLITVELREDAVSRQVWSGDSVGPVRVTPHSTAIGVELEAGGARLGVLRIYRNRPLTADERRLLTSVADLLAVAVTRDARTRELESVIAARVRQIAEQRAFMECVVDSLPVGLYVVDRDYRIQAWNHKRETGSTGVARTAAIGRTIFEVMHRQPAALLKREFDEVFGSGTMQQFQMDSSAFGELRSYRISKIPMRQDGETITHVITIGEDVTEGHVAQQRILQSEKLAGIGQLAAGIMHEINNPLATIGACVAALENRVEDDLPPVTQAAMREYLQIIDKEVMRCEAIVDGLLDFSRPKGKAKGPVNVSAILEDTLFLLKHHERFKRIEVHRELADDLPTLTANGEQLIQVFMAIMLNAMDAMEQGGELTVRSGHGTVHEDEVEVEIEDTGVGMPRSELPKIFEPFYTTKSTGRGTGLGLSICYGIVAEHGGRITVDSQPGRGSVFRVYFPVTPRPGT